MLLWLQGRRTLLRAPLTFTQRVEQIATNKQQVTRQQDLSQVIRLAVRLLNLPSDSHILQILSITLYQV